MTETRFLSIPYLFLRSATAGSALVAGLIQTFVFVRVISPEQFSLFILVGTLGVTFWLFDFGMAKILFVRTREWYLGGKKGSVTAEESGAIATLYAGIGLVGSAIFFLAILAHPAWGALDALDLALFLLFTTLNLVWFVLRNLSVATDDFVFFELLEVMRRVGHVGLMLLMLAGLPILAFLILANLFWGVLFTISARRLIAMGALLLHVGEFPRHLIQFFRTNRQRVLRTGTYGLNEFYIYTFPYAVVPYIFGLGAPTIILDTMFKVFRGANVLYSAACDLAVPRQTRAFAEKDQRSLIVATLMAAGLCSLPAVALCALLIVAAKPLFELLLGRAVVMPVEAVPLLIALLIMHLIQTVSNYVIVHTGFFREIARLATLVSIGMTIAAGAAIAARVELMQFLTVYTVAYTGSALLYLLLAIAGPIRAARR
jgi:O-antigen/teichoic acid export membrane protein